MTPRRTRLGAVGYLNSRPLVYGLARHPGVDLREDVPARCAALLHEGGIDLGLIPSIEYLKAPYRVVPGLAIASRGPVTSVALYTRKPVADIRSIAMDTSSRTSVALVKVLCARAFGIQPAIDSQPPDLDAMLAGHDAALVIGDNALFLQGGERACGTVEKIDLGAAWTSLTGLPFVWAFWAGRPGAASAEDVAVLREARDAGVLHPDELAREYFRDAPSKRAIGTAYLRDTIKYYLGPEEREAVGRFYRYAHEAGVVDAVRELDFFEGDA